LSDPRFGKLDPCDCQRDRELSRLREVSGLRGAELAMTLAQIRAAPGSDTELMVAACREFIEQPGGFLTIWGKVGTGKTSCLYAITNALLLRGAVYVSLHDLLDFVREGFEAPVDGDDARARLKRFASVPVLCLDEIDKVKPSDWAMEQLTALVDARYRSAINGDSGTVYALNNDPRTLPDWIASRLMDRHGRVVHNGGQDIRELRLLIED
jgi:DNA replication protein DnaC